MSSGNGMNDRTVQWLEQGRAEGRVEGRSRHRQTQINAMCRMAARKFDEATAEELHGRMQWIVEPEQIGEIGERLIECAHADAFLDRLDEPSLETISDLILERAKEYEAHWRAIGRAEGLATFQKQYRAQQVEVLCRMAARKFDQETAERLYRALARIGNPKRLGIIGLWLTDTECADAFLDRVEKQTQDNGTNEMITELMELLHESEALCRTEGQAQGRALGRVEVMRRQAARKFDDAAGERLAEQLHAIADSEQVGEVGEWLIACENADELFDRVAGLRESSATGGGRQNR